MADKFISSSLMAQALSIEHINISAQTFDITQYHDGLYQQHGIKLALHSENTVTKRKAEYLAGRICALKAIKTIEPSLKDIPIGVNRAPQLPNHIVASISHTHSTALCAAGHSDHLRFVGIDLENIITSNVRKDVENSIISSIEKRKIRDSISAHHISFDTAFSLVFSAKESLFKALHPFVLRYFDFDAAQLSRLCFNTNTIEFVLTQTLHTDFNVNEKIHGVFYYDQQQVLTCIYAHR